MLLVHYYPLIERQSDVTDKFSIIKQRAIVINQWSQINIHSPSNIQNICCNMDYTNHLKNFYSDQFMIFVTVMVYLSSRLHLFLSERILYRTMTFHVPVSIVVVMNFPLLLQAAVWMFLWKIPIRFINIVVLYLFFMELWVILCKFWPIL